MTKLYLISRGDVDSSIPIGIYSSYELAQLAMLQYDIKDDWLDWEEVKTFDLDVGANPPPAYEIGPMYLCSLNARDGRVSDLDQMDKVPRHPSQTILKSVSSNYQTYEVFSPISQEHARETALLYREDILRDNPKLASVIKQEEDFSKWLKEDGEALNSFYDRLVKEYVPRDFSLRLDAPRQNDSRTLPEHHKFLCENKITPIAHSEIYLESPQRVLCQLGWIDSGRVNLIINNGCAKVVTPETAFNKVKEFYCAYSD